jgi:hypothetical protein
VLTGNSPEVSAALAHVEARAHHHHEAELLLEGLVRSADQRYVSPALIALVHLGLGAVDTAFDWLERALAAGSPYLIWLGVKPVYADLRPHLRFATLLSRIGLSR